MSDNKITKNAIAAGFKALCVQKSFDKVSISDITGSCALNRQTFYYHFEDKYDLLRWVYHNDAFILLIEGVTLDNWDVKFAGMLGQMQRERDFYVATINAHPEVFREDLRALLLALFEDAFDTLDPGHRLGEESKAFYAQFYTHGCCGMVIDWAAAGMKRPHEALVQRLKQLARDSVKLGNLFEGEGAGATGAQT